MKVLCVASVILLGTMLPVLFVELGKATPSTIQVHPLNQAVFLEENITFDIDLDVAENLYGYDISLSFNNSVLNATAIEYQRYLNEPSYIFIQEVNNTGGYVRLAVFSSNPAPPKTGGSPPPLATLNFKAIGFGTSALHLYNTELAAYNGSAILHDTIDGQAECKIVPEFSPNVVLPIFLVLVALVVVIIRKKTNGRRMP